MKNRELSSNPDLSSRKRCAVSPLRLLLFQKFLEIRRQIQKLVYNKAVNKSFWSVIL